MKLVTQDYLDDAKIADECEDYRHGHKNFVDLKIKGYHVAWTYEGTQFQLTLHLDPMQGSEVIGFACGRIKTLDEMEVAIVEMIALRMRARGEGIGVKMHDFIMKATGLPVAAAHTQTPDGKRLWERMLVRMRAATMTALHANRRYKIDAASSFAALPFDLFGGGDSTLVIMKRVQGQGRSTGIEGMRRSRRKGLPRPAQLDRNADA
jgi:hypothetical protein